MRLKYSPAISIALLLAFLCSPPSAFGDTITDLVTRGDADKQSGDLEGAIENWKAALAQLRHENSFSVAREIALLDKLAAALDESDDLEALIRDVLGRRLELAHQSSDAAAESAVLSQTADAHLFASRICALHASACTTSVNDHVRQAAILYRQAAEIHNQANADAVRLAAKCALAWKQAGDTDEVERAVVRLRDLLPPADNETRLVAAAGMLELGRPDGARSILDSASSSVQQSRVPRLLSRFFGLLGRTATSDEAITWTRKAVFFAGGHGNEDLLWKALWQLARLCRDRAQPARTAHLRGAPPVG